MFGFIKKLFAKKGVEETEKIKTVERMYWDLFVEETGDKNGEVDNNYYTIWVKEKVDKMKRCF